MSCLEKMGRASETRYVPIEDDSYLVVDLTLFLNGAHKVSLKHVESHMILTLGNVYISL